ncbi:MAG: GH3 auxin-responsive promoter family protein [Phycisphaeraceae bacterium]|nr:GH3 auxin-responsive promoter family protein [Phycisphaeraceae bacterium]
MSGTGTARAGPATGRRWTSLVGHGLRVRVSRRVRALSDIAHWRDGTARTQLDQLRALLHAARLTRFGRERDFARLARQPRQDLLAAYRAAVPVADYYAYRAMIAEMREGGVPDVLWPGLVQDFAQTSGTTAGDKYIPVSRQMLRSNYLAALDIFAHAHRFGVSLPFVTGGRVLFLGGSTELSANRHGVRTGDLSGLVAPLIRWPISEIYSPGREIALMSHWPSKIEAMARLCVEQDIRMVNGMPSWALVLFERVLELARAAGRRADTLADVWPNLRLFVHGGVKYAPFDRRVREVWSGPRGDDLPCRLELYPASEGFIAIQDTPHEPGLRLLTDIGNFYEFIPLEEIDAAINGETGARAFTCDRVEPGQRYVVTMSTCAGLWRYVIGDVVEFDTVPDSLDGRPGWGGAGGRGGPARLRIVGRHRHFINAFGENLIVEHIENAVAAAAGRTGLRIGEFTAAPVYAGPDTRPGLQLAVEVEGKAVAPGVMNEFGEEFDRSLKAQNVDYTTKRTDDVGMAPPTITPLPPGAFHRWMQARGKLGGQHKCPRCANHREIIESVLAAAIYDERRS